MKFKYFLQWFAPFFSITPFLSFQFANIGPASYNFDETVSTLRYANRAKNIQNVVRINEDPKDALLRKFQLEIEHLKRLLEKGLAESLWISSLFHMNFTK